MKLTNPFASRNTSILPLTWISSSVLQRICIGVWRKGIGSCEKQWARARFFMTKLTMEWVRKAEGDLAAVRKLRKGKPPLHDEICFHCQQAVEKYIKAFMQELRLPVPRTHDLLRLHTLFVMHDSRMKPWRRKLRVLRRYAVDIRYPGFAANARQSKKAMEIADFARAELRRRLKLRQLP